jgi:hypothetical protein
MQQSNTPNSCPTTMSPFNLIRNMDPIMINSPFASKYLSGEQITVSGMTFYSRLSKELNNLFDSPFKWDNIFLAGGFISGLLETKYDPELYKESDIDMYVCGETLNQLANKMKYVIAHLSHYAEEIYFISSGYHKVMIIDCLIKGWKRRLQLIGIHGSSNWPNFNPSVKKHTPSICPTAKEVIAGFDLTHCQVAYNGEEVICTPDFIHSLTTRQTSINAGVRAINGYRLVKAYLRGFSVSQPKHAVYIKNYYHRYGDSDIGKSVPSMTDRIWHTMFMYKEFAELLDNPIVQQNLHKNFLIDFSLPFHQRMETIVKLSDATPDLYVFNKQGLNVVYVSKSNKEIAESDHKCIDDYTMEQMIERMTITNVLTR